MKVLRLKNLKYYLLMHAIVLAYGFTGILGKLIQLDFYQIVFYRMFIAGITLLGFLLIQRKDFRIKNKKSLWKVIGVGAIVVLHWLTFFKAIQVSTASVAVLCMATTALHVSWLEPLIMKRRFSKLEFILGLLVIFGVVFVTRNVDGSQMTGLIWGLISAVLSALFAVLNAYLNKKEEISSSSITIYEMLAGSFILLLGLAISGKVDAHFFVMTAKDFLWLLFLAVVCTSMAFVLMIDVINKIGAYTATLSVNLEPVYSILLAVFILSENDILGPQFYLGSFFIVLIVFANPILKSLGLKRKQKKRIRHMLTKNHDITRQIKPKS